MKDKLDKYTITVPKQMKKIFLTQLVIILIMGFLGLFVILQAGGTMAYISGVVMAVVQIDFMYARGFEAADYDLKGYTKTKPYNLKGVVLSLPILAVTVILSIIYHFIWLDSELVNLTEILLNLAYIIWTIPYYPFTIIEQGSFNIFGMSAGMLIPTMFLGLGYILRLKNFDLSKLVDKLMYEEK